MKALLVYDGEGKVYGVYGGVETAPEEIHALVATMPDGNVQSVSIDTETGEPVWEMAPNHEEQIAQLQQTVASLESRIAELES